MNAWDWITKGVSTRSEEEVNQGTTLKRSNAQGAGRRKELAKETQEEWELEDIQDIMI